MQDNPAKTIKPYSQYFKGTAAVYRNALPQFNNELIDIMSLSVNDNNMAYECLDHLLNAKGFTRAIEVNFDVDTAMGHLYFEARNNRKNKGHHILGLGYPLLISKQEKDLIALPLFIWPLTLEVTKKKGEWTLKYPSERPVRLNPYFPHFMMMKFGIDIEPDIQKYFGSAINAEKLAGFCNYLANRLNFHIKSQQVSLMPCPGASELDSFTGQDTLHWSGIIGNFPHIPPQSKSDQINEFLTLTAPTLGNHHFSTELLDPWQSSVTENARNNFITLVEGSPGTGKTHLLKHFATNALANGNKCLIVSEHIAALQSIQKSLLSDQLGDLAFLLSDEISDKVTLGEVIKARAKSKTAPVEEMPQELRVLLDRLQRRKETLDAKYKASRQQVFGEKGYAETLGLFLESSQLEPKELLNSYLEENDFSFTEAELDGILDAIGEAPVIFNEVGTLDHPLTIIHSNIFLQYEEKEALDFIKNKLHGFAEEANSLQHKFIRLQNEYSERLKEHYNEYFQRLRNKAFDLKEQISDYTSHYGAELRKSGKGTLKLYGVFSQKFKKALAQRENIFSTYEELQDIFSAFQYFEHRFEKTEKNIDLVSSNLEDFIQHLQHWWQLQNESTKDELMRLTHKTAHPHLHFSEPLKALEDEIEQFIDRINESGLYQLPLQCNMLTIPRKQRFLEDKMSMMEQTLYHLRDFGIFYPWQKFWFSQNTLTRKVIKALGRVNPGNWEAAFRSWYFSKALSLAFDPDLPNEDFDLKDYHNGVNDLITQLPGEINRIWAKRRSQKSDDLKKVADEISSKNPSVKEILQSYSGEVTDYFPIILATQKIATAITPYEAIFDYLLIDEAQSSHAEASIALFPLAKRVVVFTDPKTENLPDAPLPKVLRDSGTTPWVLENYHANRAADLGRPDNNLNIRTEKINGRFEETSGINTAEADRVIHLLNNIRPTSARTFPSVGIVCLTKNQRDFIADYLLRIKQRRQTGVEIIQQLERNGLGVFHINELDGRLFDQVILSGTFGETESKKKQFTKKIQTLNSSEGIAGMYKLMGCVKSELQVIHSIPAATVKDFLKTPDQLGTFLLGGLIKAIHLPEDLEPSGAPPKTPLVWQEQLERSLRERNPDTSFKQENGFLIIQDPDQEKAKLLLTDGCFAQTQATDFYWEYEQRLHWEKTLDVDILPVWPVEWR